MNRSLVAILFLLIACGGLLVAVPGSRPEPPDKQPVPVRTTTPRLLPGLRGRNEILLPNQWSLRPAGQQLGLGDFPVNSVLHPTGKYLAVLHAGFGEHEIAIVALGQARPRVVCRVSMAQTFLGLAFAPDGNTLYASGGEFGVVHSYTFRDGMLFDVKDIVLAPPEEKFVTGGVSVTPDGKTLCAAGTWGDAVVLVPLETITERNTISLDKGSYPYACLPDSGDRVFVSLWGKAAVAVVDRKTARVIATWPVASHPTELVLSPDGKTLYAACSNSTQVVVLDTTTGKERERVHVALFPESPSGSTPSSLSLTPDGDLLFVANADNNNVAVFNVKEPGKAVSLGFIPTGWYPTAVRYNAVDRRLYVTNGKGLSSRANRQGPYPGIDRRLAPVFQYSGHVLEGVLSVIDMPAPERLAAYTKDAYACSPLRSDNGVTVTRPADNPIPGKVGEASPIKYVIYIIKENRTYDQVLGDMPEGNGEAGLCLFGEKVTPNHHKLAREFVLLDNFYVDGEVSADGHQWSMAAYATDFVEKMWPLTYRGSPTKKLNIYPSEGSFPEMEKPAGGYIWNRCFEAGVSFRTYGEWIANGKTPEDPSKATLPELDGHFDPKFRGYDLDYPDQKRADRFIEELKRFEKEGDMPRCTVLRLPNDHTFGTRVDKPSPRALVADNDLALGRLVEAVSQSKYWKETAIFVIEDDSQDGPDHVDCHRVVALAISPYTKRGAVDSTLYSTTSMLRTMELILGLKPMSQYDAAATPMYNAFQARPDLRPFAHTSAQVDLNEKNTREAWGAEESGKLDFSKEDVADEQLLNAIIWHSVKGPNVPMPAPVRAAFWMPHVKHDD